MLDDAAAAAEHSPLRAGTSAASPKTTEAMNTMRIGDKVSGIFHDVKNNPVPFTAIVSGGDTAGGLHVDFLAPFPEWRPGDPRKSYYFSRHHLPNVDLKLVQEQAVPCLESACIQGHYIQVR